MTTSAERPHPSGRSSGELGSGVDDRLKKWLELEIAGRAADCGQLFQTMQFFAVHMLKNYTRNQGEVSHGR